MKKRITRADDIIWRKIGEEIAVIIMNDDGNQLHILNKTAAHIWEMCNGEYDADEIATNISERYDVTLDKARADVANTINKLEKLCILKWDKGGTE